MREREREIPFRKNTKSRQKEERQIKVSGGGMFSWKEKCGCHYKVPINKIIKTSYIKSGLLLIAT